MKSDTHLPAETFLSPEPRYPGEFPFSWLIAFDELGQFGLCHGLSARLSAVLVRYVAGESGQWWNRLFMDPVDLAGLLRRVVILNLRSPGSMVGGKPAGQAALALLQGRFGGTRAATATQYWYYADRGCRG